MTHSTSVLIPICVLIGLLIAPCRLMATTPISLRLDTGSALQVIAPINKADAQDVRSHYYKTAIPLARTYGFTNGLRLNVKKKLVGSLEANTFILSYWKDAGQWEAFKNDPAWPELKSLRKEGWQELALFTQTLATPVNLEFHPDKHYTLAFAWLNPEHPKDYFRYIENIEPALKKSGGRFLHKIIYPSFESNDADFRGPGQITLVEWESEQAIQTLLKHPDYTPHKPLLETGVIDFTFMIVEPAV